MVVQPDLFVGRWRPGGATPDAFSVTRGGYVERTDATGREFPVQNRDSDLHHVMRPFVGPAHLLLLGHAVTDDLIQMLLLIGRPLRCRAP